MKRIKLYCIPYAGGSSSLFYKLQSHLNKEIELCPIELPGHGMRCDELLLPRIEEMAKDVYSQIKKDGESSFAILGYSMGGLIAFELMRLFSSQYQSSRIMPYATVYAAVTPPHLAYKSVTYPIHQYDDERFLDEVISLGGININDEKDKEILQEFVDILRNDFGAVWRYETARHEILIHDNDVYTVFSDSEDAEAITEWRYYTKKRFHSFYMPDGHFFINSHPKELASVVNTILSNYI